MPRTAAEPQRTPPSPSITEQGQFDEEFYLTRYPDVARGVAAKHFKSGWHHYNAAGRREGREARMIGFDPVHYLRSYPQATEEIAAGLATDAADHYRRFGKARAFLPNPDAERPGNPAAPPSRFGGLWPDLPNAHDIIAGKLEIGQITEAQAELLRFWIAHGYVILQNAIPPEILGPARDALERAHSGQMPRQLFECGAVVGSRETVKWRPEINDHPAKALDIHFLSRAIRNAIFADAISDFMALVFESRALASQTLGFWRGSAQTGHQDTAYVAYSIPRNFVASWIALEDVTLGAGELFYHERSHTLEDWLYGGEFKTIHDWRRMNDGKFPSSEVNAFVDSLRKRTTQQGMEKKVFAAKAGDVLIWHADLVHGGNPVSRDITRKSVVTHYCPSRLVPLYFENRAVKLYDHGPHRFASGVYLHSEPGEVEESAA
ncbi:MAG TPA: phytanoyl-CoA dioxygenase family protein [Acetobacteraceae bacterium]|nr:phytanoyl-CoA dioxygenase family protein [Acetobacteraceae bacterium]